MILSLAISGCCGQVVLDPIPYPQKKEDIISKTKLTIQKINIKNAEDEKVSDEVLTLAKGFNANINSEEYKLKVVYKTDFSTSLFMGEEGAGVITLGSFAPGVVVATVGGPLGVPVLAVGAAFFLVTGTVAGTYQVLGGPWWTTATVSIDAVLTYHSKEIGKYHTDGFPDKRLISCWYGQCPIDADKTAEAASFKLGLEDIFNQINQGKSNSSKKKDAIQKKETDEYNQRLKLEEEARQAKIAFRKKHGKDMCQGPTLRTALMLTQMNPSNRFNQNCIYDIDSRDFFRVFQQTRDGTLVQAPSAGYGYDSILIFIEKNETDKNLVDGAGIPYGKLNPTGTYSYTNVMGSTKTIYKFKRISD